MPEQQEQAPLSGSAVASAPVLAALAEALPPAECVFAYGSGVFAQQGSAAAAAGKLVDLIVVVRDAREWHAQLLASRPSDYALLPRLAGADTVACWQRLGPGKTWFHADVGVRCGGSVVRCKYGVIALGDLVEDLERWDALYVAGRLHKPVKFVSGGPAAAGCDVALARALAANLRHAAHAALFCLPERFSELDFFRALANLSYAGDVRMAVAEDPDKVDAIVRGSLPHFRELYGRFLPGADAPRDAAFRGRLERAGAGGAQPQPQPLPLPLPLPLPQPPLLLLQQDTSKAARAELQRALPQPLADDLVVAAARVLGPAAVAAARDAEGDLAYMQQRELLARLLAERVRRASQAQALRGLLSAGPATAAAYALRKVGKRLAGALR
jgi:translocator assembly and maintenance protein 41